jgi:hypothetical protein
MDALPAAIEDGVHYVARLEIARGGKAIAHDRFQRATALGPAPLLERQRV